jgi:hypothetical protein
MCDGWRGLGLGKCVQTAMERSVQTHRIPRRGVASDSPFHVVPRLLYLRTGRAHLRRPTQSLTFLNLSAGTCMHACSYRTATISSETRKCPRSFRLQCYSSSSTSHPRDCFTVRLSSNYLPLIPVTALSTPVGSEWIVDSLMPAIYSLSSIYNHLSACHGISLTHFPLQQFRA